MSQKLHKDLSKLLDFHIQQRQDRPELFAHSKGLISNPSFFTIKDLQRHINNPLLRPEWLHIKTAGRDVLLDAVFLKKIVQGRTLQFIDKEKINQELGKGCALVLEGIDILESSVNAFCEKLDNSFPCSMSNSVVFFSQSENEAYAGHCDVDDVLVIQLAGQKIWHLFAPQKRRYKGMDNQSDTQLGPVLHEVEMAPGDALYVTAGVPHRCVTPGEFSLHMSFDLLDATPNIQQISGEANKHYLQACELPYVPGSKIIDNYIEILKSGKFRTELSTDTLKTRMQLIEHRKRLARSASVTNLRKFF